MRRSFWIPIACFLLVAPVGLAQQNPTFSQNSVSLKGLNQSTTITITSPYDDCTMTITATSTNPTIATVTPPGPVVSNTPVTFTISSGTTRAGSAVIIFLFGSDPPGCVLQHQYTITVTVTDPGAPPPRGTSATKQVIEPVSMDNGALVNGFTDLALRGPFPIRFERYYYSNLFNEGGTSVLGPNWMHSYEASLALSGTTARVSLFGGQALAFTSNGGKWTQSSIDPIPYQLQQSGNSYRFLDPVGQLVYTFDGPSGQLQSIQDRGGNTQTLTYTGGALTKVDDGFGSNLTFTYAGGQLAKVTDQSGRSISFGYTNGTLGTFTDVAGRTTYYSYTGNALMTSVQMPRGNTPYITAYDPTTSQVITQRDAAGNTFTISVDQSSGVGSLTDPLGNKSSYTHVNRALTREVDPAGSATTYTYDTAGHLLTRTDANGNATAYTYDATSGMPSSTTLPDGGTVGFTYTPVTATNGFTYYDLTGISYPDGTGESFQRDANGNATGHTDRNGKQWQSTYNGHGQVLTITSPLGAKSTFSYNSSDGSYTLASAAFPDSSATTFKSDNLKRIVARVRSDGTSVAYTYDAYDHILTQTDEAGGVTTYTYDANGLLASAKDPDGGVTSYTRTGTDQIATVTDGAGRVTTIKYDADDRPGSTTLGDGSSTQTSYDAAGNPVTLTDGEGKVWTQGFDKTGVLSSLQTPLGNKTVFTLDSLGRATKVVSPAGRTATYTYDKLGRLSASTDPLQLATSWTYDKNGNLSGNTIPGSISAAYQHDADGRLTGLTDPNGNVWSFTYDGLGRLLGIADPLGQTQTLKRDARGRVNGATLPLGTMTATVDGVGRLTEAKYSDSTTMDFKWDAAGRLASGTGLSFAYDASGLLTNSNGLAITRDKAGRVATVTLAAGKTVTYTYDRRGLVTSVADWVGGATALKWDDEGRLVSITRPNGVTTTYGYDADGAVTSIAEAGKSSIASTSLTRDARGFVTQANRSVPANPTPDQLASVQTSHSYDAADQIADFKYDSMGRRASDDAYTYTWDLASHLTGYSGSSGSSALTYNAMDLVAGQTLGAVTTTMVWNFGLGLPSISVIRSGSTDLAYYVHTPDGQLLHSIDGKNARRFYHYDEMGNTIFLTDDTGTVTDQYAYTEYGALIAPSGTVTNPFLFAGRFGGMQIGAQLYAMRQRVYDARSGAFLSRDPLQHYAPALINPYQYAAGNPLRYLDVTGAEPGGNSGTGAGSTPSTPGGQSNPPSDNQSKYNDIVRRIYDLYRRGRITGVQKNNLLKFAKKVYVDTPAETPQQNSQTSQGTSPSSSGMTGSTPLPPPVYTTPIYPVSAVSVVNTTPIITVYPIAYPPPAGTTGTPGLPFPPVSLYSPPVASYPTGPIVITNFPGITAPPIPAAPPAGK